MPKKSKFETHVLPNLEKIKKWAQQGATAKEIAKKLGVGYSTFKDYLARGEKGEEGFSAFRDAYASAGAVADDEVEAALFKRACGISYEEVKTETREGKNGEIVVNKVTTTKFIPPDPVSMMFWLANRRRDKWQYRPDADGGSSGGDGAEAGGVIELAAVMPPPEEAGKA